MLTVKLVKYNHIRNNSRGDCFTVDRVQDGDKSTKITQKTLKTRT